jgi:hypothetical protein
MPSFSGAGTPITQRIVFNSGTLDFGSNRLVMLESVNVNWSAEVAEIYTLGSIIRQDIARHSVKVSLTGKIKSFAPELDMRALGSSTTGTPQEIDVLDGQPTLQNPVLTIFDKNGKQIQYQLVNAMFKSLKVATSAENYAEWDFEMDATNIVEVYTA